MKIGSFELVEIDYLCRMFGITRRSAFKWLRVLQLTTLNVNEKAYFSTESLEIALRVIAEAGVVFSMPGSDKKLATKKVCRGIATMTDKMRKRVSIVQTRITDNFNAEVKQWEKEKSEIKQAKKELTRLRKAIQDVTGGVHALPKKA